MGNRKVNTRLLQLQSHARSGGVGYSEPEGIINLFNISETIIHTSTAMRLYNDHINRSIFAAWQVHRPLLCYTYPPTYLPSDTKYLHMSFPRRSFGSIVIKEVLQYGPGPISIIGICRVILCWWHCAIWISDTQSQTWKLKPEIGTADHWLNWMTELSSNQVLFNLYENWNWIFEKFPKSYLTKLTRLHLVIYFITYVMV